MNLSAISTSKISSLTLYEILWAQNNLWKKVHRMDKDCEVFSPLNFFLNASQPDLVWLTQGEHILSSPVKYQTPSKHSTSSSLMHFGTSTWNLPDSHFLIVARPNAYIHFPHYLSPKITPIPGSFSKIHSQLVYLLLDPNFVSSWQ